jgi:coenzyme F420-reducing hydrogenase gamma subunit
MPLQLDVHHALVGQVDAPAALPGPFLAERLVLEAVQLELMLTLEIQDAKVKKLQTALIISSKACNTSCATCNGPSNTNCLSCPTTTYLSGTQCVATCPERTASLTNPNICAGEFSSWALSEKCKKSFSLR